MKIAPSVYTMFSEYLLWPILIFYVCVVKAFDVNETSTTPAQSTAATSSVSPSIADTLSLPPEITIIHLNSSRAEPNQGVKEDVESSGEIAAIVIGVLTIFSLILAVAGYIVYKHVLRKGVTSMNFDNPVYRKTTEDQFSLEKNQYLPARSYPPSLEPLTSPGTNEFV